MKIALIRHPAPLIEPGICYGRLDVPVEPTAVADLAARLADDPALHGMTQIWTSPAHRCRALAEAIALDLPAPMTIDARLRELGFGEWEGRSWDLIAREELDRWAAAPLIFAPPGGESGAELVARVRGFHADLLRHQQDCVVVSHGGPLKILTALLQAAEVDLMAPAPPIGSLQIIRR